MGDAGLQEKMVQRCEFWHGCAAMLLSVSQSGGDQHAADASPLALCLSVYSTAATRCASRWTWTLLLLWLLLRKRSLSVTGF